MISFNNNFFFLKFAALFFILVIFGYWGIDLNSEELYIAFSFFLLVTLSVILFRRSVTAVFVHSLNTKYFRFLKELLISVSSLSLSVDSLTELEMSVCSLSDLVVSYSSFFSQFFVRDFFVVFGEMRVSYALFEVLLPLSYKVFLANSLCLSRFQAFGGWRSASLFSINMN